MGLELFVMSPQAPQSHERLVLKLFDPLVQNLIVTGLIGNMGAGRRMELAPKNRT